MQPRTLLPTDHNVGRGNNAGRSDPEIRICNKIASQVDADGPEWPPKYRKAVARGGLLPSVVEDSSRQADKTPKSGYIRPTATPEYRFTAVPHPASQENGIGHKRQAMPNEISEWQST